MNSEALKAWRGVRRLELLTARGALTLEARRIAAERIFTQVETVVRSRGASIVGAYLPIRNEPDVLPWIRAFVARGGTVALPVVEARGGVLSFHCWAPGQPLRTGPLGTRSPAEPQPVVPELLVVPLLGFDPLRFRLGYGGGYYDRTLAAASPRPYTVGVGFAHARLETIYPQPHDQPLDCILTESGSF